MVLDVYVPGKLNKGERELVERLDESLGSKGRRRDGGSRWRRRATRG